MSTGGAGTNVASRLLWDLDEYIVVADLYLRRGRTANTNDPEVVELADLTGRSRASISWRLGNFAGTVHGGGAKPAAGEALAVFESMRADLSQAAQLASGARRRLAGKNRVAAGRQTEDTARVARPVLAMPEQFVALDIVEVTARDASKMQRREAALVQRYRAWRDACGERLRSFIIPCDDQSLRTDLFDTSSHTLIEAKAAADRNSLRQAIGQLFDYRRYITPRPELAILVPSRPKGELMGLPSELGIGVIWREGDCFVDSVDARLAP